MSRGIHKGVKDESCSSRGLGCFLWRAQELSLRIRKFCSASKTVKSLVARILFFVFLECALSSPTVLSLCYFLTSKEVKACFRPSFMNKLEQ